MHIYYVGGNDVGILSAGAKGLEELEEFLDVAHVRTQTTFYNNVEYIYMHMV